VAELLFSVGCSGRAIAQAVSHWLLTAAARVRAQVRSCGSCGAQGGMAAGFLRVLRLPLPIFIPPVAPQSPSSIIWGWYNRPIVAAVPSLTPLIIIIIIIIRWVVCFTFNSQAGGPTLVGCLRLLVHYIRSFPPYLKAVSIILYPRTRHAVVTRDPLSMWRNIKRGTVN
jgi:hypothetical protein